MYLAALGLHCSLGCFSSWGKGGAHPVAVGGFLIVVTSPAAAHRLQGAETVVFVARGFNSCAPRLQSSVSVVVVYKLSRSETWDLPESGI